MAEVFEVEPQGDHQYVIRLRLRDEAAESWFNLSPSLLDQLGVRHEDEDEFVRRTVAFLLAHQDIADFPAVVELEDVLSVYADYADVIRPAVGR